MEITGEHKRKIKLLAKEGRKISDIFNTMRKIYPDIEYIEVYSIIKGSGGASALGLKRTVTNRLLQLLDEKTKSKREEIIIEIDELISYLYKTHKQNRDKLIKIREALKE